MESLQHVRCSKDLPEYGALGWLNSARCTLRTDKKEGCFRVVPGRAL